MMREVFSFIGERRAAIDGVHFTVVSEDTFRRRAGEYALTIVPEQNELEPETEASLGKYVEAGGAVIVTQTTSFGDPTPSILRLAGVSFHGFTTLDYGYTGTPQPFHTRSRYARIRALAGTDVVHPYEEPLGLDERAERFGHGLAPPGRATENGAVTERRVGAGRRPRSEPC